MFVSNSPAPTRYTSHLFFLQPKKWLPCHMSKKSLQNYFYFPPFVFFFISVLPGHEDVEHIEVSAGHAFHIECSFFLEDDDEVVWTLPQNQSLHTEINIIDKSLLFLPALKSHSGKYFCSYRYKSLYTCCLVSFSISMSSCLSLQ